MCSVNLRVPPNLSQKIDEIKKKSGQKTRNDSTRSSISLRIPNRSIMSLSEVQRELLTPIQTPVKLSAEKKTLRTVKSCQIREKASKIVCKSLRKKKKNKDKKSRDFISANYNSLT